MSLTSLIRALTILRKYGDPSHPTHCEHDVLTICGIPWSDLSEDDHAEVETLGFLEGEDDSIQSFRYGSA
jgi:hypothetical protein